MQDIKDFIKAEAISLGFCLCGFTDAEPSEDFERYTAWLAENPIGTMKYLTREDTLAKRADPRLLLPDAQSICVLAVPMGLEATVKTPEVASYAHYIDYHEAILPIAEALVNRIREQYPAPFSYRICIDSAPILERSLAVRVKNQQSYPN